MDRCPYLSVTIIHYKTNRHRIGHTAFSVAHRLNKSLRPVVMANIKTKNLPGKTALITGGSKGIGFGVAEAMVAQGMKLAVTSRHQEAAD